MQPFVLKQRCRWMLCRLAVSARLETTNRVGKLYSSLCDFAYVSSKLQVGNTVCEELQGPPSSLHRPSVVSRAACHATTSGERSHSKRKANPGFERRVSHSGREYDRSAQRKRAHSLYGRSSGGAAQTGARSTPQSEATRIVRKCEAGCIVGATTALMCSRRGCHHSHAVHYSTGIHNSQSAYLSPLGLQCFKRIRRVSSSSISRLLTVESAANLLQHRLFAARSSVVTHGSRVPRWAVSTLHARDGNSIQRGRVLRRGR